MTDHDRLSPYLRASIESLIDTIDFTLETGTGYGPAIEHCKVVLNEIILRSWGRAPDGEWR